MFEITETKDCDLLTEMNEEIQTFHHISHPNIFKPFDKESIRSFFKSALTQSNCKAFVALDQEVVEGYVLLFVVNIEGSPFQHARNYLLVDQILVLKEHRSKGIGKLLMDAVFSFAKSQEIETVELNHWSNNDSARQFFRKIGFEYFNEKMWKAVV